jgi:hypothetical protein
LIDIGLGTTSPVKIRPIKVKIEKEELDHLEKEERRTMRIFMRSAKRVGTVQAIEKYLQSVNIDEVDGIMNRYGGTIDTHNSEK